MNELEHGSVSMSLEEPAEIASPVPATANAPAETETPPPEADDPDPDGTISAAGGVKFVPLDAVKAERKARKDAEKAAKDREAEAASLKEKAAKYDEAASYLQQAKPIIDTIRNRPDILELAKQPPKPATPSVDPALEAEATEYAKDFDLYTADGKPDVARAMRIIKRNDERAARQAQQAVNPILQTEAQRQSTAHFQHYLSQPEVNGIKIDKNMLAETWNSVPPEVSADPRVAQVLYMNTIGRQILAGHKPQQAPPPVVPTESIGGGAAAPAPLSDTSERFRSAAGIAKKTFTELRETFKPGQSNQLEP